MTTNRSYAHRPGITAEAARRLPRQVPPAQRPIVLNDAVVIDARKAPLERVTIVIIDGTITDVSPLGCTNVPPDAITVDLCGRFVIPGLWDLHVHQFDASYLPFHLVNGVTGIRHMGGIPAHHQWRDALVAGEIIGPRMVLASPIIDGPRPLRPGSIPVHDAATARQAVAEIHAAGADFIKIYNLIPHGAFEALVDEAQRQSIPFAGHLPLVASLAQASGMGQASIEHLEGLLIAGSRDADRLQSELSTLTVDSLADMQQVQDRYAAAAASQDPAKAEQICAKLAENETWITPTLSILRALAKTGADDFPLREFLPYIEPHLRHIWEQALNADVPRSVQEQQHELFETYLRAVGRLHQHGVGLLAGTDTFVPGFSLHDELALLVWAGLSPIEALNTATYNPAAFFGLTDFFGTVEPGRVADLVILGSNPLEDITNTRDIAGLVLGGHFYDEAMLAELEATTMSKVDSRT